MCVCVCVVHIHTQLKFGIEYIVSGHCTIQINLTYFGAEFFII